MNHEQRAADLAAYRDALLAAGLPEPLTDALVLDYAGRIPPDWRRVDVPTDLADARMAAEASRQAVTA